MVIFEFQLDECEIAQDRQFDVAGTHWGTLLMTGFLLPVRLNVDGVELLEPAPREEIIMVGTPAGELIPEKRITSWPWFQIQILDLLVRGIERIKILKNDERFVYEIPDGAPSIHFQRYGDEVLIYSELNRRAALADPEELIRCCENFARSACQMLNEKVPELINHPAWRIYTGVQ